MYRVGVKRQVEVRHFLEGDFDEESIPHSHDYIIEWVCVSADLDENGFSVDISVMEKILTSIAERIRGKLLNDLPFFDGIQSSVENFARYVFYEAKEQLGAHGLPQEITTGAEVVVWESSTAWASYRDSPAG